MTDSLKRREVVTRMKPYVDRIDMKDQVKQITGLLVDSARERTAVLAKDMESNGQLSLPHQLAVVQYTNDAGEDYYIVIGLDLPRSMLARRLGATIILFYVYYGDKFVVDHYTSHWFGRFYETVGTEAFRQETEKKVTEIISDDCKTIKKRIEKEGISNINQVLCLPDNCTLSIHGQTFEGAEGLKDYVREQTDSSQPYIVDRCQRFPCFDSEDYANEYRFYRNFLICHDKQEADDKLKRMKQLPHSFNFCLVSDELPDDMRPMVYYADESMTLMLAY